MPERETRDSIQDVHGSRSSYFGEGQWPVRVDQRIVEGPERWVQSCCMLCSNGCGMDIGVRGNQIVGVRGRAIDQANCGRLGPKGLHELEANGSPDRLKTLLICEGGRLCPVSWDEAMDLIVARSKDLLERYGGNAIGFHGTGQAFLEGYYTLAAITYAGLRTPHTNDNTRLCTATAEWALLALTKPIGFAAKFRKTSGLRKSAGVLSGLVTRNVWFQWATWSLRRH